MRAGPIGVYPTVDEVLRRCRMQAAVTHGTPDGNRAACAAALMTHYFIYRVGPKQELGIFLETHVEGRWNQAWHGKVKSKGWMSVRAAVTALMRNDRLSDLLRDCIQFSGDVDTVAAIALAAASCCADYEQDLPRHLVDTLENGPYGRSYLIDLDGRLRKFAETLDSN